MHARSKRVLSIQSFVNYGHVGNSTAMFTLQRMGIEVCPLLTLQFSNHTGYGDWEGDIFGADLLDRLIYGMEKRGVFPKIDALLSGYVGGAELGGVILNAHERIKEANKDLVYLCDPVIGDRDRGVYVKDGIGEFFKEEALRQADIITPNHFEAEYLTGMKIDSIENTMEAVGRLHEMGPGVVVITSLECGGITGGDKLGVLASGGGEVWLVETDRVPGEMTGTGDTFSALMLGQYLRTGDIKRALELAVGSIYGIVERTHREGSEELMLVGAQGEIVEPKYEVVAKRVDMRAAAMV